MTSSFRNVVGFLCLSALVFRRNVAVDRGVPVLMWSNDGSLTFPSTLAGHTVSQSDFRQQYVNKLLSDNDIKTVAVFVQDKLSVDELSRSADVYSETGEGGAFKQTKNLITELPSAYLSSVSSPSSVFAELGTDFPGKTYTLQQPFNMADLMVSSEEKKIVLVHLPEHQGSGPGLANYIHRIDEIISNVTSQLSALPGRFAALYTGRKSRGLNIYEQHSGRHLLASSSKNQTGLNLGVPNVFLMYTTNVTINYNENRNYTELSIHAIDWTITSGQDCPSGGNVSNSNATCTIHLAYLKDVAIEDASLKNLTFQMIYTVSSGIEYGYWYLKKFSMTYHNSSSPGTNQVTVDLDSEFVAWTPFKFSYHCHQNPPITPKGNVTEFDRRLSVSFKGFQVQAFYVRNANFGYYNDCVGFFTIPIWSAIICSAVLIAILFFGVIMLMNIKTPDRMDDAKGKTISVTVSE